MPTSVALTPHFEKLTKQLVASGKYNNVSEVVREGLRMIEERENLKKLKLQRLKDAIKVGQDALDRGDFVVARNNQELRALFDESARKAKLIVERRASQKAA
jgi:antitoxin ParD1/3/4